MQHLALFLACQRIPQTSQGLQILASLHNRRLFRNVEGCQCRLNLCPALDVLAALQVAHFVEIGQSGKPAFQDLPLLLRLFALSGPIGYLYNLCLPIGGQAHPLEDLRHLAVYDRRV